MSSDYYKEKGGRIYDLGLHDTLEVSHHQTKNYDWSVMRVASGWIYTNRIGSVFVPFDNRFQEETR